jgi:mRNA-degrading endonuclease YafQ of YafQ-DinJ toxin-antitoxin module
LTGNSATADFLHFNSALYKGLKDLKKQIKRQLNDANMTIIILELHFDGHNGDHLLVYVPTDKTVFLAGIGTHSELFG